MFNQGDCFKGIALLSFFLAVSCQGFGLYLPSVSEKKGADFFLDRKKKDSDRKKTLAQSYKIYTGKRICSSDSSCGAICRSLFSLSGDQEDCNKLPREQVYQFEKLFYYISEKKLSSLEEINIFDLKVFLNLSPEPLFKFFQTLDPIFTKTFLYWIAVNWQIAKIFKEEDWDFLFLDIFLNKGPVSPISFLEEELAEGRTFMEWAWLKQNDYALLWLDDYFRKTQCEGLKKSELKSCVLAQYCLISAGFQNDVSKEIMGFKRLKSIVKPTPAPASLKDLCSNFCSSKKGQAYCQ